MAGRLPPPRCACSHLWSPDHPGSGRCRFIVRHVGDPADEDHDCEEKCERCPCAKFRVPDGPGRKARREQQETNALVAGAVASALTVPGAGFIVHQVMKPPGKRPWWR